jgi:hypothetical protein
VRQLRALLRHRVQLVRLRTLLRNRIHAVLADHGHDRPAGCWSGPGRAWLDSLPLPSVSREVIDDDLALIDALQIPIDRLDLEVRERARSGCSWRGSSARLRWIIPRRPGRCWKRWCSGSVMPRPAGTARGRSQAVRLGGCDGVHPPLPGHAFQFRQAAVLEADSGPGDHVRSLPLRSALAWRGRWPC